MVYSTTNVQGYSFPPFQIQRLIDVENLTVQQIALPVILGVGLLFAPTICRKISECMRPYQPPVVEILALKVANKNLKKEIATLEKRPYERMIFSLENTYMSLSQRVNKLRPPPNKKHKTKIKNKQEIVQRRLLKLKAYMKKCSIALEALKKNQMPDFDIDALQNECLNYLRSFKSPS